MVSRHIHEGVGSNRVSQRHAVDQNFTDGVVLVSHNHEGLACTIVHGHIAGRRDGTISTSSSSDGVGRISDSGEGDVDGSIGGHRIEEVAADSTLVGTVNLNAFNYVTLSRSDAEELGSTAVHDHLANRTDVTTFSSRSRDGVSLDSRLNGDDVVSSDAVHINSSHSTEVLAIEHNAYDFVAVVSGERVGNAFAVLNGGVTLRSDFNASSTVCGNRVGVLSEGGIDGVVSMESAEGVAVDSTLLNAVNHDAHNVVTLVRGDFINRSFTAVEGVGRSNRTSSVIIHVSRDGVGVHGERSGDGVVGVDCVKDDHRVGKFAGDILAVHRDGGQRVAIVSNDVVSNIGTAVVNTRLGDHTAISLSSLNRVGHHLEVSLDGHVALDVVQREGRTIEACAVEVGNTIDQQFRNGLTIIRGKGVGH